MMPLVATAAVRRNAVFAPAARRLLRAEIAEQGRRRVRDQDPVHEGLSRVDVTGLPADPQIMPALPSAAFSEA